MLTPASQVESKAIFDIEPAKRAEA